jgi:hypothetical protein
MIGKAIPGILKPLPVTMTELTDTAAFPDETTSSDCVAGVLIGTLPNATLDALTPSEISCTANCKRNVSDTLPALAVRVTVCTEPTGETVAAKLAVVDPVGTVTEFGTVTAELLLERLTAKPLPDAAALKVTEQLSLAAPVIDPKVHVRPLNTGLSALPWPTLEAFNCRKNVSATSAAPAVNVAVCTKLTEETVAEKLAEADPAATVTLAGKTTAASLLVRLTAKPPLGATALKVTAQSSVPPPVIDPKTQLRPLKAGFSGLTGLRVGAFNCKAKVSSTPLALAVSVAVCAELTGEMEAVKPAVVDPAATVIEAGTATAELSLARSTAKPPLAAAELNVTVQLSIADPITLPDAQLSDVNAGLAIEPPTVPLVPVPLRSTTRVPSAVASLAIVN